ncbi:hypothetical protein BamIOP4010DRAFT_3288 [Burkholderia ambifaria IOP40-10]|uniref:Uncharacterized protein n=1 Tax=Burkholderia ambifaria IOP40-10 TaxID=396596 RepID=B1FGX8_9BURK|nr:hypothetical protein BamIOP4010DRAFT_3288 [Burkholderia ambifaria IOP40-10]
MTGEKRASRAQDFAGAGQTPDVWLRATAYCP